MGIDPGKSGGLCNIRSDGTIIILDPMPKTEMDIWNWMKSCSVHMAYIEKVHSFPGQGVASTFTFGMGYGGLRMALTAAEIPFGEVTPRTWQKNFGISPRKKKGKGIETQLQFKERLRAKCQQLFPSLDIWDMTLTLQRSVCDAILIAEYARRKKL